MCSTLSPGTKRYTLACSFRARNTYGVWVHTPLRSLATGTKTPNAQTSQLSAGPKGKRHDSDESATPPLWPRTELREANQALPVDSQFNRLEAHLEMIRRNERIPPSIDDLERFKPKNVPDMLRRDFKGYRKVYKETLAALTRSFTANQLYRFVKSLVKVHKAYKLSKTGLIQAILERHWGMPQPEEEERRRRALVEIRERISPLKLVELFLLLGQDGSELKALASRFRVQLFIEPRPIAIRALGLEVDLCNLAKHLSAFRKSLTTEVFSCRLKYRLSPDIIQSMSRLVTTFIEPKEHGMFKLTSVNERSLQSAKRLIYRALMEEAIMDGSPLFAHTSGEKNPGLYPPLYSLFPFVSPSALPWNMGTSSAFRCRQVGEWIMGHKMGTIKSLDGEGTFLSSQIDGEIHEIRKVISDSAPSDALIQLTARTGHLVLKHGQVSSQVELSSPLPGSWPLPSLLQWLRKKKKPRVFFVPSAPLLQRTSEMESFVLELKYYLVVEPGNKSAALNQARAFTCQIPLSILPSVLSKPQDMASSSTPGSESRPRLSFGTELRLDLLLPHRPLDLRIMATTATREVMVDRSPESLKEYIEEVAKSLSSSDPPELPVPPESLLIGGQRYHLFALQTIKNSFAYALTGGQQSIGHDEWPELSDFKRRIGHEAQVSIPTEVEDIVDLETETQSSVCLVSCPNIRDDTQWKKFLRDCDHLTLQIYQAVPAGQRAPSLSSVEA